MDKNKSLNAIIHTHTHTEVRTITGTPFCQETRLNEIHVMRRKHLDGRDKEDSLENRLEIPKRMSRRWGGGKGNNFMCDLYVGKGGGRI